MLKDKTLLITGGTDTFEIAVLKRFLNVNMANSGSESCLLSTAKKALVMWKTVFSFVLGFAASLSIPPGRRHCVEFDKVFINAVFFYSCVQWRKQKIRVNCIIFG